MISNIHKNVQNCKNFCWTKAKEHFLSMFPSLSPVSALFEASGCNEWPPGWSLTVTASPAAGGPLATSSSGSQHPRGLCWQCQGQSLQSWQPWCCCCYVLCEGLLSVLRSGDDCWLWPGSALIYTRRAGQPRTLGSQAPLRSAASESSKDN